MVMGEASEAVWTEEFRRAGRVVFPVRPRGALANLGLVWLIVVGTQVPGFGFALEDGGAGLVVRLPILAFALGFTGWCWWLVTTKRPVLTLDNDGIRVGRKRFLPWAEVGAIGIPRVIWRYWTLPVIPRDVWAKELRVDHLAARDVTALAHWLEEPLKENRRDQRSDSASGPG